MLTNSYQTSFRSGKSLMDGTVLMDLFKAFDCIPHGLLVSKLLRIWSIHRCNHIFILIFNAKEIGCKNNNTECRFKILLLGD